MLSKEKKAMLSEKLFSIVENIQMCSGVLFIAILFCERDLFWGFLTLASETGIIYYVYQERKQKKKKSRGEK